MPRVFVTGIGMVSPIGLDEDEVWARLIAGRTGIAPLTAFDTDAFPTPYKVEMAAQVDDVAVAEGLAALGRRSADRALDLVMVAADRALRQAGLAGEESAEPREIPTILGTATGSAQSIWEAVQRFTAKGPKGLLPSTVPRVMYNSLSANVSMHFQLTGANYVVISACTSATNAIGDAFKRVRDGETEIAVTGGSDASLDPFFYGVWNNIGVLSPNPDPELACRPFDAERQGTTLGEAATVLVLESEGSVERRGRRVRGEILGYGESSDAGHITGPSAEGQARAIERALESAGVRGEEIGYVNAHGTATRANDTTESAAIRLALGDAAADATPVGSNKSFLGHTLGACGAIESAITLLALERRQIPPNFNLRNPDPECRVRLVGAEPEPLERPIALKNSFGFGGGNGVLVLAAA